MLQKVSHNVQVGYLIGIGVSLLTVCLMSTSALAINQIPTPEPKPGSFGIEATKTQAPPTQGATITTPGSGASFSTSPITVNGICPDGLLVQIYNNGVMVGSVLCSGGSFTLQVSLFAGSNELSAVVYDELDQPGPVSNLVTVNYTDTSFTAFGSSMTLTSSYGRRSAPAGSELVWPLQLSGGTSPYAFSIDWGDGSATELKSQLMAGVVTINHPYKKAGIYQVNVKVIDVNEVTAFLQVVAVANGKVDASLTTPKKDEKTSAETKIIWMPSAIATMLLIPAFWLGRRSQIVSLRNKMLKDRENYESKQ